MRRFVLLASLLVSGLWACVTPPPTSSPSALTCQADADCLTGYQCKEKKCSLCMACLPSGDLRCDTLQSFQTCQALPNGCTAWASPTACPAGNVCSLGRCVPPSSGVCSDICVKGDRRCVEGEPYLCDLKDGCAAWLKQASCPASETCNEGRCSASPPQETPVIELFKPAHPLAFPSESISLTWKVRSATTIYIKPLHLTVPSEGNLEVRDESTATYTLEASFGNQKISKSVTIERNAHPPTTFRVRTLSISLHYKGDMFVASLEFDILGNEVTCFPGVEWRLPDGKTVKEGTSLTGTGSRIAQDGSYLETRYRSDGVLLASKPTSFRIWAFKTTEKTDCSTPVVKEFFYPAKQGSGEAPWEEIKSDSPATPPPKPQCPSSACEIGKFRCNGADYQACVNTAYCGAWSEKKPCGAGNECFADIACLPVGSSLDRASKEILVQPGFFAKGVSPVKKDTGTFTSITHRFYIWKHEFTNAEYIHLIKTPLQGRFTPEPQAKKPYIFPSSDFLDEARYTANLLSKHYSLPPCYTCASSQDCEIFPQYRQGNIKDCLGYRLPTDDEWEYAYRAGAATDFHNGNMNNENETTNHNLGVIGWYKANSNGLLQDIGLKQPNAWGLYDMAGNAAEAFEISGSSYTRGGSFESEPVSCTAWNIGSWHSTKMIGFRPVRTAP